MKPCKVWTRARTTAGYGVRRISGKNYYVHRLEWERHHGPIPKGICICHRCDNPACYEIEHLFDGKQAANLADMVAKGRARKHRKLTDAQVRSILADTRSQRRIAPEYGVTQSMISHIKRGHSWRHL